nr:hypothetical protein [Streptomyces tsukubensis NRRL18488]
MTGRLIREAAPDPLIAAVLGEITWNDHADALLWMAEGRLAARLADDWTSHQADVDADIANCQENLQSLLRGRNQETVRRDRFYEESAREDALNLLQREAQAALKQCEALQDTIAHDFGRRTRDRVLGTASSGDTVTKLDSRLGAERMKLVQIRDEYERTMSALSERESRNQAFIASGNATAMETIKGFGHRRFELFVASLLERDGYTIERRHGGPGDEGADVIATDKLGARVVVQCKHTSASMAKNVIGADDVHKFNGTARPEHRATLAVMMTNGWATDRARTFAGRHDIIIIESSALQRLAEYGESIRERIAPIRENAS